MIRRQHKFIDHTNNEPHYHVIEYINDSDYAEKVLAVIESVKEVAEYEDTGEYLQITP
tara:strand:+ start:635 stop:808 length:174 start_codon:yes stop_codon:yes gene_type:complete